MTNDAAILTNLKPLEFTFPSCISIYKIIYFKHDKLQVLKVNRTTNIKKCNSKYKITLK